MKNFISIEVCDVNSDVVLIDPEALKMSLQLTTIIIFDLECHKAQHFLKNASHVKSFDKKTKWLFFAHDCDAALTSLKQLDINIDTRILLFVSNNSTTYKIFHVQAPALKRNGVMHFRLVGNYSNQKGVVMNDPFHSFNQSLDGVTMLVGISVSRFFSNFNLNSNCYKFLHKTKFSDAFNPKRSIICSICL